MSTSQLVGAAGIGLIAANAWTGRQRDALSPLWTGNGDLAAAHRVAKEMGVETLAVAGLVLISTTGDTAGHACLAVVASLWLVWLMAGPHGGGGTTGRKFTGPLPGLGPLLPPPSGHGPTITTLPRNTIPGLP